MLWKATVIVRLFQYAAKSHRILVEVYSEHALAERMCQVVCTI